MVFALSGCKTEPEASVLVELQPVEHRWSGRVEVGYDGTAQISTNAPGGATCSASTDRDHVSVSWHSEPTWGAHIYGMPGTTVAWACVHRRLEPR